MVHRSALGLSAAVLALAACPSPALYQTAEPLAPGQWQLGAAAGGTYFKDLPQQTGLPGANLEVWARRGVGKELDLGLRLFTVGAEISAKWRFIRGKRDVALMPALSALRTNESTLTTEANHGFASLPLIVSQDLTSDMSISYGPRVQAGYYQSTASSAHLSAALGGFIMLAYDLGPIVLMPEFDLSRTALGDVPVDGWTTHLGLGVSWSFSK